MKRDEKGRFAKKDEEGLEIMIGLPPLKRILTWIFIIGILMPWISIIRKNNWLKKLWMLWMAFFKKLLMKQQLKRKMDYFPKLISYFLNY